METLALLKFKSFLAFFTTQTRRDINKYININYLSHSQVFTPSVFLSSAFSWDKTDDPSKWGRLYNELQNAEYNNELDFTLQSNITNPFLLTKVNIHLLKGNLKK